MVEIPMASKSDQSRENKGSDAARAIKYMVVKAAVFIAIPLVVAVATALWVLQ